MIGVVFDLMVIPNLNKNTNIYECLFSQEDSGGRLNKA